ncbi:RNMTL1 [Lepeophtheirus salmonis]|uniref:RNMTL1 n=1 Tax=Lepeophtheirus salmonis TaxID=72036 RepID=A0A7R8CHI2_LEPSM|nr:RNMTL1 [Lepeophtheirus salmonis]CAF2824420.1 RNMTL1 [Lepeophtheirus salmonis]
MLARSVHKAHSILRTLSTLNVNSAVEPIHKNIKNELALPRFTKVEGWAKEGDPNIKILKGIFSPIGQSLKSQGKLVILEGKRLIVDALNLGLVPSHLLFSRFDLLKDIPLSTKNDDSSERIQLYQTSYRLIKEWSSLTTPTGLMAAFSREDIISLASKSSHTQLPMVLILDNVRNPDNMGAILRSAAASGVSKIIATHGCVDVWNDKCIRGGCGAHFMLPLLTNIKWDLIHRHVPRIANTALADLHRKSEKGIGSELEIRKTVENLMAHCVSEYRVSDAESPGDYLDSSYFEESILSQYASLDIKSSGETQGISPQARNDCLIIKV